MRSFPVFRAVPPAERVVILSCVGDAPSLRFTLSTPRPLPYLLSLHRRFVLLHDQQQGGKPTRQFAQWYGVDYTAVEVEQEGPVDLAELIETWDGCTYVEALGESPNVPGIGEVSQVQCAFGLGISIGWWVFYRCPVIFFRALVSFRCTTVECMDGQVLGPSLATH